MCRRFAVGLTALVAALTLGEGRALAQVAPFYTATTAGTTYNATNKIDNLCGSNCEDQTMTLPWAFRYYDRLYTQISISTEGYIRFRTGDDAGCDSTPLPFTHGGYNTSIKTNVIAPLWANWKPGDRGDVRYENYGSKYVIEWREVSSSSDISKRYTFMLVLFPDGSFEFHYPVMFQTYATCDYGMCMSSGFQGTSADTGYSFNFKSASITQGSKVRFVPKIPGNQAVARIKATELGWGSARVGVKVSAILSYTKAGVPKTQKYEGHTTASGIAELTRTLASDEVAVGWGSIALESKYDNLAYPGPYQVESANDTVVTEDWSRYWEGNLLVSHKPNRRDVFLVAYDTTSCTHNNYISTSNVASWATSDDCPLGNRTAARHKASANDKSEGYCYLNKCKWRSTLDYFYGRTAGTSTPLADAAHYKAMVIVPGMDAYNEDDGSRYHAFLANRPDYQAALELQRKGVAILVGNYGDGYRHVEQFRTEVKQWVDQAYSWNHSRKVIVMGISQGGVVIKMAVNGGYLTSTKVSALFSFDAPLRGSNLGWGGKNIQTLIACEMWDTKSFHTIFSWPAWDMNVKAPDNCQCRNGTENGDEFWHGGNLGNTKTYPEQIDCDMEQTWRLAAMAGHENWNTTIPRYAFTSGDMVAPYKKNINDHNRLYEFNYSASYCSDGEWDQGRWDCYPGSRYLHKDTVDSHDDTNLFGLEFGPIDIGCGDVHVTMNEYPVFITTFSALDADATLGGLTSAVKECPSSASAMYDGFAATPPYTGWSGKFGNAANWPHCEASGYLGCKIVETASTKLGFTFAPTNCGDPASTSNPMRTDLPPNTNCSGEM